MRATTLILCFFTAGAAEPPRHGPVSLLTPEIRPAGSATLPAGSVDAYKKARARVRTGNFRLALRDLETIDDPLFADRLFVLRGQALQAIGNHHEAKRAYLQSIFLSNSSAVNEAAVRGLIAVTGPLGDYGTQLAYLDAILSKQTAEPDPRWPLLRAQALYALNRKEEARAQLWELVDSWPEPAIGEDALRLLRKIERSWGRDAAVRVAIARANHHLRAGKLQRAQNELKPLRRSVKSREHALALDLTIAEVLREQGARSRAEALLAGYAHPDALLLRARIAMDRYHYRRARELFSEVIALHPGTAAARAAVVDSIQLEYDARDYPAAAQKAERLLGRDDSAEYSSDIYWLAGWSSYLAGRDELAQKFLAKLGVMKSEGELKDAAEYWSIRSAERAGRVEEAGRAYRSLASRSPLGYYGLLAQARLEKLGEPVPIAVPPAAPPPATVEEVIALLGADRPQAIDRATLLLRAGLRADGVEELLEALEYYRRTGHQLGAALTIELFCLFERDAWVFLLARTIAEEDGARLDHQPDFWRIWHYAYPTPFEGEVGKASRKHEIDPLLVYAVMRTESLFRPDAVSPAGARGLMQLMPYTARWIGRTAPNARLHARRYRAPESNVWLGAWYVKNLLGRYKGNVVQALGAYNAGPGAMDRWVRDHAALEPDELAERTPYEETRRYVRRALESYLVYRRLYGGGEPITIVKSG